MLRLTHRPEAPPKPKFTFETKSMDVEHSRVGSEVWTVVATIGMTKGTTSTYFDVEVVYESGEYGDSNVHIQQAVSGTEVTDDTHPDDYDALYDTAFECAQDEINHVWAAEVKAREAAVKDRVTFGAWPVPSR